MPKVAFINGSPKTSESCSLYMIETISKELQNIYDERLTINALKLLNAIDKETVLYNLISCDAVLVVFPLYADSLPSSLLELLEDLEAYKQKYFQETCHIPCLYGLVNCGFIDSFQNINALKILENYCQRAGFKWCGGIGIGSGEMLRGTKDQIPLSSKMNSHIYSALSTLIKSIRTLEELPVKHKILFGSQKIPQRLFILMGNAGWPKLAKTNGLTKKMLYAKPYSN